jgi:hypothetical protein
MQKLIAKMDIEIASVNGSLTHLGDRQRHLIVSIKSKSGFRRKTLIGSAPFSRITFGRQTFGRQVKICKQIIRDVDLCRSCISQEKCRPNFCCPNVYLPKCLSTKCLLAKFLLAKCLSAKCLSAKCL